jgi:glycosyltransferase involved in cell wall biosynthesis
MNPTVTVDARLLNSGGIGTYLEELLDDLDLVCEPGECLALLPKAGPQRWKRIRAKPIQAAVFSLPEQWAVPSAVPRGSLLHVPHFNIPLVFRGPLVLTAHDLIQLQFPENFRTPGAAAYAHALIRFAVRRADQIITGSCATRQQLIDRCGVPERKIHVIPYRLPSRLIAALSDESILAESDLTSGAYFLHVGQAKAHKNIPAMLDAFANVASENSGVLLATVTYSQDPRFDISKLADARGIRSRVKIFRRLPFGRLRALYENALATLLPSFQEGFGLPVLESMAFNTPVIASDIPAIREAGGDAMLAVNPRSPGEFADAMRTIIHSASLRRSLANRGRDRATAFMSMHTGEATRAVYDLARDTHCLRRRRD